MNETGISWNEGDGYQKKMGRGCVRACVRGGREWKNVRLKEIKEKRQRKKNRGEKHVTVERTTSQRMSFESNLIVVSLSRRDVRAQARVKKKNVSEKLGKNFFQGNQSML